MIVIKKRERALLKMKIKTVKYIVLFFCIIYTICYSIHINFKERTIQKKYRKGGNYEKRNYRR